MKACYGTDGNLDALGWLELMSNSGVTTLTPHDRKIMEEAGIVKKGKVVASMLETALKYQRSPLPPQAEPASTDDIRLIQPAARSLMGTDSFGLSNTHPFKSVK